MCQSYSDARDKTRDWTNSLAFKWVTDNYTNDCHTVRLLGQGLAHIPWKPCEVE